MPRSGQSRLLLALEAILEPLVTVLSLWLLVWLFEGELSPSWLIVSVVAFALASPGRSQLRLPPDRVFGEHPAGLGLDRRPAAGDGLRHRATSTTFRASVVLHWLWFAPAAQLATHWALRAAAPHLVRLQGPPLRAVVVGHERAGLLAGRPASRRRAMPASSWSDIFDDRTPDRQL